MVWHAYSECHMRKLSTHTEIYMRLALYMYRFDHTYIYLYIYKADLNMSVVHFWRWSLATKNHFIQNKALQCVKQAATTIHNDQIYIYIHSQMYLYAMYIHAFVYFFALLQTFCQFWQTSSSMCDQMCKASVARTLPNLWH